MRLGSSLRLGRLTAVEADDTHLPRLVGCVRGCLDYFARAEHERSAERVAQERLSEALADETRQLFLLQDARGEDVGLLDLALEHPAPDEATLALLVLSRARRGHGLGREVAEAVFDALAQAGYSRVRLGVAPGEDGAAEFWAAIGMWECGEDDGVRLFERPLA